jgi:hypothetical protein
MQSGGYGGGYGPPPGYGGPPPGYGGPPPGYGGPPPKPKGPSLGLVVVLCVVGVLFVVPFVVGGVIGFMRASEKAHKKSDPEKVSLSEQYDTKNKLITAHYPPDFAAKRLDDATITISRRVGTGDEFITLGALPIDKSVTDDVDEFARLMLVSVEKNIEAKDGTSTRGKKRETKCLGKYEGVEFSPTFKLPGVGNYVGKACFFVHNDRHYIVRYDVIKSHAESDTPLLERIIDATEFAD